jgi:hypothetical protein
MKDEFQKKGITIAGITFIIVFIQLYSTIYIVSHICIYIARYITKIIRAVVLPSNMLSHIPYKIYY